MSESNQTMPFGEGELTVIVGATEFKEFGEGTVSAKRLHPKTSLTTGLSGHGVVNKSFNDYGEVTIPVLATSGLNAELTSYYHLYAEGNVFIPEVLITHKSTGARIAMTGCWISDFPELDFSTEVQSVSWVIHGKMIATA